MEKVMLVNFVSSDFEWEKVKDDIEKSLACYLFEQIYRRSVYIASNNGIY
jgi:hypothetical protein